MKVIEIKDLTKIYNKDVVAIDNMNIDVNEGEIFGFIGSNGAGKSTTIKILLNLIFPTKGTAKIFGLNCTTESKKIKEQIAYVPSEVSFYKSFKVKDVFKYAMTLSGVKDQEYLDYLIKYFELDCDKFIKELSLGNKKKVSIIQALLKRPKVLILDEPTSGLDPLIQEKLFKILLEMKKANSTIFLSSHNLTEVEKYCDRVCVIKQGKIINNEMVKEINKNRKIICKYKEKLKEEVVIKEINENELNDLIKFLNKKNLEKLEIQYSSLEEMFMKYYNEEGT